MAAPTWMQFEPSAFLVGVEEFSMEERGIYITLLCLQWERGGYLPPDRRRLAKLCHISFKRLDAAWDVVGEKFEEAPDGFANCRLLETLEEAENKSNAWRIAGKKGAAARWAGHSDRNGGANGHPTDTPMTRASKCVSPSRSTSREGEEVGECEGGKAKRYPEAFESFWTLYPRKTAKATAYKAWKKASKNGLPDLETLSAALKAQGASEQWKRKIIPHASTWLNQERWEDKLPAAHPSADEIDWSKEDG